MCCEGNNFKVILNTFVPKTLNKKPILNHHKFSDVLREYRKGPLKQNG